ncbi:hypothetical protein OSTOST_22696, partial [Ostertagia ostertagi]
CILQQKVAANNSPFTTQCLRYKQSFTEVQSHPPVTNTVICQRRSKNMASAIYREFELMIQKYGEDGVKTLMPLVVNVLEALDLAFLEREEAAVDQEMLKEDNEQLKYMEIEDNLIGQNKELEAKIESH